MIRPFPHQTEQEDDVAPLVVVQRPDSETRQAQRSAHDDGHPRSRALQNPLRCPDARTPRARHLAVGAAGSPGPQTPATSYTEVPRLSNAARPANATRPASAP